MIDQFPTGYLSNGGGLHYLEHEIVDHAACAWRECGKPYRGTKWQKYCCSEHNRLAAKERKAKREQARGQG